jgi:hypothetical protein
MYESWPPPQPPPPSSSSSSSSFDLGSWSISYTFINTFSLLVKALRNSTGNHFLHFLILHSLSFFIPFVPLSASLPCQIKTVTNITSLSFRWHRFEHTAVTCVSTWELKFSMETGWEWHDTHIHTHTYTHTQAQAHASSKSQTVSYPSTYLEKVL